MSNSISSGAREHEDLNGIIIGPFGLRCRSRLSRLFFIFLLYRHFHPLASSWLSSTIITRHYTHQLLRHHHQLHNITLSFPITTTSTPEMHSLFSSSSPMSCPPLPRPPPPLPLLTTLLSLVFGFRLHFPRPFPFSLYSLFLS